MRTTHRQRDENTVLQANGVTEAAVPDTAGPRARAANMLQELGSVDTLPVSVEPTQRPLWRGRLHQFGVVVSVPMLVILAVSTRSATELVAVLIYAVGLSATFGVSAIYHLTPNAPPRWRSRLQRADHATIYLGIGGTCTPVCLIGLPTAWGIPTLAVVGAGVAGGITCSLIPRRWAEITSGVLYIAVGWSVVVVMPALVIHSGWAPALFIALGGVLYTVGAFLFSKGIPRLSLRVFGYHEVWHTFTLLAAGCHFVAVWLLVN
jgi:hemolysin III